MSSTIQITTQTLVSKPMLERLISATCLHFGIEEDVLIKGTAFDIINQKHICWYLIKEHVVISNDRIGQRFSIKDSSTVRRGIDKIQAHKIIYAQTLHDIKRIKQIADTLA